MSGLTRRLAALWDGIPVKGPMAFAVTLLGIGLVFFAAPHGSTCTDSGGLRDVYRPKRLKVVAECQTVTFRVVSWRHEHDGDYHVNGVADVGGWTNAANGRAQHGDAVFEFVPGDPRPSRFYPGQRLRVLTTKVLDVQHSGWVEGHPVFRVEDLGGPPAAPGPAPTAEEP